MTGTGVELQCQASVCGHTCLCAYLYVCVCVCVCVLMHVCRYVHVCAVYLRACVVCGCPCVGAYVCMCACMCLCMRSMSLRYVYGECVCVCVCVCMCVRVHVLCMCVCLCLHVLVLACACACLYMLVCVLVCRDVSNETYRLCWRKCPNMPVFSQQNALYSQSQWFLHFPQRELATILRFHAKSEGLGDFSLLNNEMVWTLTFWLGCWD